MGCVRPVVRREMMEVCAYVNAANSWFGHCLKLLLEDQPPGVYCREFHQWDTRLLFGGFKFALVRFPDGAACEAARGKRRSLPWKADPFFRQPFLELALKFR